MRLYAPMYEGDSILRPDAAIGAPVRTTFKAPAPAADFVRSNIQMEAANQTALDIHAIEQTARALRSIELARLLKNAATSLANGLKAAHTAVADWLERIDYQERDNFFAASANLADLEQRQRHFERTGLTHY
ncbi:MAG TPA: hypothetical protein VIJ43_12665 [Burkholderiales bacterium]